MRAKVKEQNKMTPLNGSSSFYPFFMISIGIVHTSCGMALSRYFPKFKTNESRKVFGLGRWLPSSKDAHLMFECREILPPIGQSRGGTLFGRCVLWGPEKMIYVQSDLCTKLFRI